MRKISLLLFGLWASRLVLASSGPESITAEPVPGHGGHQKIPFGSGEFYLYILYAALICCFAGLMSGLTVGYTSIDPRMLAIKLVNGSEIEKENARKIKPIIDNKHLLIATLLTANALAMESLPIFLDAIMPAMAAILVSTSVVLVFGEVVPQAICLGPNQIQIAAGVAPIVKWLILLFYPICYPISKGLDFFLGHHSEKIRFAKKDLKALMTLQVRKKKDSNSASENKGEDDDGGLTEEEINIINSTIDLRTVQVSNIMVPMNKMFVLSDQDVINQDLLNKIIRKGFSDIPIFTEENKCLGILTTKKLLNYKDYQSKSISESKQILTKPFFVVSNTNLLEALSIMQVKKTNILLVSKTQNNNRASVMLRSKAEMLLDGKTSDVIGLITLKDIFEQITQEDFEEVEVNLQSLPSNSKEVPATKLKVATKGEAIEMEYQPSTKEKLLPKN